MRENYCSRLLSIPLVLLAAEDPVVILVAILNSFWVALTLGGAKSDILVDYRIDV